jgi:hypothetical protein
MTQITKGNEITSKGLEILKDSLIKNQTLREINFSGNYKELI